jgi:YbbR domain-containing protein
LSWIKDRIRLNWGSKLFALAAATALWWSFGAARSGEEALEATVRFVNTPDNLEVNPDQIPSVTAILRGPRTTLQRLRDQGLALLVDSSDIYGPGQHTANINRESLRLPSDVEFVKATPSQFRFLMETSAIKEVEVVPQFVGEMQPGYALGNYVVQPRTLRIRGPEDRVSLVEAVQTDPIDLRGEVGDRSYSTTGFVSDPYLRFVDSPEVTVYVTIRKRE